MPKEQWPPEMGREMLIAERKPMADERAIEAAISNLDAIIIRCMEGDRRTNWLPTIARLAEEARAALAHSTPDRQERK